MFYLFFNIQEVTLEAPYITAWYWYILCTKVYNLQILFVYLID
jgi:hypothetical protein